MIGIFFEPFIAQKLGNTENGNSLSAVAGLAKMPLDQL